MGFFNTKLLLNIFLFLFLINSVYSSVEVFSSYNSVLKVNLDNTIQISKNLTIKNIYDVGIVPGQIEFKVGKGADGSISNIGVKNVIAKDRFGNEIKTQVRSTKDYTLIILDIYYPLLPGFEYKFDLVYTIDYQPGGIFFKSLQIPLRESTIPIESGRFSVILPNNYYFTYLSSEGKNATIVKNLAYWEIKNDVPNSVTFEYSYIPIKIGNFQGSYVFWILINLILLGFLLNGVRKEIIRLKKHNLEEE